jgi:hypothetical protein
MCDVYEVAKRLTQAKERVQKLEDSITGAASFTLNRQHLNSIIKEHILWLNCELDKAKEELTRTTK